MSADPSAVWRFPAQFVVAGLVLGGFGILSPYRV